MLLVLKFFSDIQVRLIIWQRSPDESTLRQKYYQTIAKNAILKAAVKLQYQSEYRDFISKNLNPENEDYYLSEYYAKKNAETKEPVIGCIESLTNYTMGRQEASTSFLLEAGSLITQPKSLFDTKQCPTVDKINNAIGKAVDTGAKVVGGVVNTARNATKNLFSSFFGGK